MNSQNDMLKKDILDVLSKQINGGGDTVPAYPNSNVPKTYFGLAGAIEPKKSGTSFNGTKWKRDQVFKYEGGGGKTYIIVKTKVETDDGKSPKVITNTYTGGANVGKDFYYTNIRTYGDINVDSRVTYNSMNKKDMEDFVKYANEKSGKKPAKAPKAPKKNPAKAPKKKDEPRIDPLHQVSKKESKKSKSVKKPVLKKDVGSFEEKYENTVIGTRYYNKDEGFEAFYDGKSPTFYKDEKLTKKHGENYPAHAKETLRNMWVDSISNKKAVKESKFKDELSSLPSGLSRKFDTHKMPDGSIHTGKTHTKDSKVVKPAPKDKLAPKDKPAPKKSKKPLTEYQQFVKDYSVKNKNLGKDLMKKASIAWKEFKKTPEFKKQKPKKSAVRFKVIKESKEDAMKDDEPLSNILSRLTPKQRKKYVRAKTKKPLTAKDIKALSKPKKECPEGKVLNPKTNRCKKVVKKRNVKQKSTWMKFLAKFRAENPQIKGTEVMKQASIAYKDIIVPHKVDSDSEDELPAPPDTFYDEDYIESLPEPEDNKFNPPPKKIFKTDTLVELPEKSQNETLADILDSFDAMIKTLETVANSNTRKSDKEKEFNMIADRAFSFYEKLPLIDLDPLSKKRVNDSFEHVKEIITTGYQSLISGTDVAEYREYEDDDLITSAIDNQLLIPESVLDTYVQIREADNQREELETTILVTQNMIWDLMKKYNVIYLKESRKLKQLVEDLKIYITHKLTI